MSAGKGTNNHAAILTEEDVILIRRLHTDYKNLKQEAAKISPSALACKFGVAEKTIKDIIY